MKRTEFFSSASGFSCALGRCLGRWAGTQEADSNRSWRRQHAPVRAFLCGYSTCWPQKMLHFLFYFSFWSRSWDSKCRAWHRGIVGVSWGREQNLHLLVAVNVSLYTNLPFYPFPEKWWLAMIELVDLYSWKGAAFFFAGKIQSAHLMTSSQCFRLLVVFVSLLGFFSFAFFFFSCWKSTWKKKKKKKYSEFLVMSGCLFLSSRGIGIDRQSFVSQISVWRTCRGC